MQYISTIAYTTVGAKRKEIEPDTDEAHMVRHLEINLPAYLSEDMWNRYQYSLIDIYQTLKVYKSFFLWHLALVEFLTITNSSCKRSTDQLDQFIVTSKQIVSSKLKRHYQTKYKQRSTFTSVIDAESKHLPPLPLCHHHDSDLLARLAERCIGTSYQHYDSILPWVSPEGFLFVPREIEGKKRDKLWMNRIQTKEEHIRQHGHPSSLTMAYGEVMINDIVYVFMDESFVFQLNV